MNRQTKDELIALWRDAKQGFKWTIIVISAMLLIGYIWDATAQTRYTVSGGIYDYSSPSMTTSVTIQHYITPVFAFAAQANVWDNHTNLAIELKTDITQIITGSKHKYQLDASTGLGWAHYYYDGPADHNYHTYMLGLDLYRHFEYFSIVLSPTVVCRTWQGHIGLHHPALMTTIGISTTL